MTAIARYLSHPGVRIDPAVSVPDWGLSTTGGDRVRLMLEKRGLRGTVRVVSSAERKAVETAEPIAAALPCRLEIRPAMHENDRSSTGFLPPDQFESVADDFFARPDESIRGWERALDAQARILAEVEQVLREPPVGDILFVGHCGVGTLLLCHCAGWLISRHHDQMPGGGCWFSWRIADRNVLSGWQPMETLGD